MIEYSERESELFKLRFGRATLKGDFDQWNEVKNELNELGLDFLRLKVSNPGSDFVSKLAKLSPHVYLTGIIRLYKIRTEQRPQPYFNPDIVFKKVLPSERKLLKDLIKANYTDCPMGYYQYPVLEKYFPLDLQLENISSYLSEFCEKADEHKEAYIGYIHDQPVACFASDISDPLVTDSPYAGIISEFRDKGVFRDILKCHTHLCMDRGAKEFIGGGRLENLSSQHAIEKEKGICYGYELAYMIAFDK